MQHGVAVGANRDQVRSGVYLIVSPNLRYWNDVVDVDVVSSDLAVGRLKIEITDLATGSMLPNA